jgi:DNA primase
LDLAHIAWAVNLGCLGFHVWPYRAAEAEFTDELRIDLDPQPGTDFTHVREAVRELRGLLDELGIVGYPKTTGNKGLHVYVRLESRWDSYQVRSAAVAVARELERRRPDVVTAQWWKEDRASECSSTSIRTRRTRRCSVPGACAHARVLRCRRPLRGTRSM